MEATLEALKAKKADLQRTREKVVKMGKSTLLFDRLISGCDRAMNEMRRRQDNQGRFEEMTPC
jgi:hypothetical protein